MLTDCKHFDQSEYVVNLDRMPFGLLDFTIQFFTCTHIKQVSEHYKHKHQKYTTLFALFCEYFCNNNYNNKYIINI